MKTAFAVIVVVMIYLLAAGCYAQSAGRFQSVGGEYGQSWISTFKANNPQPTKESGNGSDLWKWGSAPKGSMIANGKLVVDPYYYWKALNYSTGWLGDAYVDPYTGQQVYSYVDPNTGIQRYFYIDPNTEKPVYTNEPSVTGIPTYAGVSPFYSSDYWSGSNALPPIFNSDDPWS